MMLRAMWNSLKRLSLGLGAIALAAAVLLLTDENVRTEGDAAAKTWKVRVLEFVNITDVEDAEKGVRDGLRDAGLTEGREYVLNVSNAQGDMTTLNGLVDAAISERADLIVTLSTPTLQAALQRVRNQPIVFTFLANPFATGAGAGTSDTEHLSHITGAYGMGDAKGMVEMIRKVMPQAKRVGTMFVPNEVNSVFNHNQTADALRATGMEVFPVGVSTPAEVPDAALSLCSQKLDLVCLP